MKKYLVIALPIFLISGCATGPQGSRSARYESRDGSQHGDRAPQSLIKPVITQELADSEAEEAEAYDAAEVVPSYDGEPAAKTESKEQVRQSILRIAPEDNEMVQKWIRYFSQRDSERFQRFMDRGEKYRELIETTLEENELPSELYYLAMIESGFNTHANSTAKAKGVWQFMPATGKRYGLEVGHQVDERRDPIRATEAAARYLKDLHNVFGSWHLAMAAYNAGETRIMNAVFRGRSRDYWELGKKRVIPVETANYVPKMLAAMIIARDYKKYGLRTPQSEKMADLESVEVPSPIRLQSVANATGVSLEVLQQANPHILKGHTPLNHRSYDLWVPKAQAARVQSQRQQLAGMLLRSRVPVAVASEGTGAIHVVKRGENLSLIGRKYGVSTAFLIKTNGLSRSGKIHKGQRLHVTGQAKLAGNGPRREVGSDIERTRTYLNAGRAQRAPARVAADSKVTKHKVRRGENLGLIARRFGVSVSELKKQNRLRRDVLHVGQVIRVEK